MPNKSALGIRKRLERRQRIRRIFLFLSLALCSSACAPVSTADQEIKRISTITIDAFAKYQACFGAVAAKPEYAHLYTKFPIRLEGSKAQPPTQAQLTDEEVITDDDIGAGLDWYSETEDCDRAAIDQMGKIDPELTIAMAKSGQQRTALIRDIAEQKPTYGAANRRLMEWRAQTARNISEWAQGLKQRIDAMRRQDQIDQQNYDAMVNDVTNTLANAAIAAVQILAERQALTARAQFNFVKSHPKYLPTRKIDETVCGYESKHWACHSKVLDISEKSVDSPRQSAASIQHLTTVPVVDATRHCWAPSYPEYARQNREQGTVSLKFWISDRGTVLKSEVETSSGFEELDVAAMKALSLCDFKPGTIDGQPVAGWARIRYDWRLVPQ